MKKQSIILLFSSLCLLSCAQEEATSQRESSLRGAYTSSESIYTKIKHSLTDGEYLYAWSYPQFLLSEDQDVLYRVDQRLELKRDFTYAWNYTIILGNPGEWGNLEIAKIAVNVMGTFSYHDLGEGRYSVDLSNPTSGKEEIYGSFIGNMAWFGGWSMHPQPDLVNDFSSLPKEEATYSKYVCARKVNVHTEEDGSKVLTSYLFYRDCLQDIAVYSTY